MKSLAPCLAVVVMAAAVMMGVKADVEVVYWTEECAGPVCGMAEKQAEGLARLRVLSDYIKETMKLMESVVVSLDEEMVEVAQELQSVVGRRCYAREHAALNQLVNRDYSNGQFHAGSEIFEVISDPDYTSGSNDITQGSTSTVLDDVDSLMEGSSDTSQSPSRVSHSTTYSHIQRPSSPLFSTSENRDRTSSQQQNGATYSTSQIVSSTSQSRSTTSRGTEGTSWQPSSSQNFEEVQSTDFYVAPEQPPEVESWRGGSGRKQGAGRGQGARRGEGAGRGQGVGRGKAAGRGQGVGRGEGAGRGQGVGRGEDAGRGQGVGRGMVAGRGQRVGGGQDVSQRRGLGRWQKAGQGHGMTGSLSQGSNCRGVSSDSPHYVPGLDKWCADNCPRGFCPSITCVC